MKFGPQVHVSLSQAHKKAHALKVKNDRVTAVRPVSPANLGQLRHRTNGSDLDFKDGYEIV